MEMINRWILIIKPKTPFLNWLKSIPGCDPDLTLLELRESPTTILIPKFDAEEEVDEFIKKNGETFFESELLNTGKNKEYWPKNISFKLFKEWFDIETSSIVFDFVEQDILKD